MPNLAPEEIENYIFDPELIYNSINKTQRRGSGHVLISFADIDELFDQITEEMKYDVNSQLTAETLRWAKKCGSRDDDRTIIRKISREFEKNLEDEARADEFYSRERGVIRARRGHFNRKVGRRSLLHRWSTRWTSRRNTTHLKGTLRLLNDFCQADSNLLPRREIVFRAEMGTSKKTETARLSAGKRRASGTPKPSVDRRCVSSPSQAASMSSVRSVRGRQLNPAWRAYCRANWNDRRWDVDDPSPASP